MSGKITDSQARSPFSCLSIYSKLSVKAHFRSMHDYPSTQGSLVLYKSRPAIVTAVTDKIDIELEGGKTKRVRPKDILLLHPGPLHGFPVLEGPEVDVTEAWELVAGGETDLEELAELIYGVYDPAAAWATWQLVVEGLYFEGEPGRIRARTSEQVAADKANREVRRAEEAAWAAFLQRLKQAKIEDQDRERLREVERLALGRSGGSRIMQALGIQETPAHAHRLLLNTGYWEPEHNPYPARNDVTLANPEIEIPSLPDEPRLDLTQLPAFAIDDEGSEDPDDAVSLDGDRIWVHVADVSALVAPDSALDREARARGSNLYLPDRVVHMLPTAMTGVLGVGLQETSPALSLGFRLDAEKKPVDLEIVKSTIRVSRFSYADIDRRMNEEPFATLGSLARDYRQRRMEAGAVSIDLPEARVRVSDDGVIQVSPLERLASRSMVTDLMLMAGEVVALFALEKDIPVPFATQAAPAEPGRPTDTAGMFAFRRQLRPSRSKSLEEPHAGLGMKAYCRVTSPLRRYLDLVTHQQLRAYLDGGPILPVSALSERMAVAELASGTIRRTERLSNLHWKLIYLQREPGWQGTGVVVEMKDKRATLIIPELALESRLRMPTDVPLNTEVSLNVREIDLTDQKVWFRINR